MCWSAEVSTVFSILDVAAIAVLCFRNQKRDRYYALAAAPIAGQELCQIFLWLNMGTDSSTFDTPRSKETVILGSQRLLA